MGVVHIDNLIIGGGIIGLTMAYQLHRKYPDRRIAIIEKEDDVAQHASGRNSGVLHAGFYYTSDSLKAKFTVEGNRAMKAFCQEHQIPLNECQKLVVAKDASELESLQELYRRGVANGVKVELITEEEAKAIDAEVKTYRQALFSPTTATVNPKEVCAKLRTLLEEGGVEFYFSTKYLKKLEGNRIKTNQGIFEYKRLINAAGLYADRIAKDYGYAKGLTIIPFKGIYLKADTRVKMVKTNVYPVPNLLNPFLGVHYTVMQDGQVKLGPTSIPALWRENYRGWQNFKLGECFSIAYHELRLFVCNAFNFRKLALEEMKKYDRKHFLSLARHLTHSDYHQHFKEWSVPGIRAQLLDVKKKKLVMDFVLEGDEGSVHVLNAVSPAFTCSFPFTQYVIDKMQL